MTAHILHSAYAKVCCLAAADICSPQHNELVHSAFGLRKCFSETFVSLDKMQALRSLYFLLACTKVKNFAESISLCTFAVSFRDGEMLIYLYKPIIIN